MNKNDAKIKCRLYFSDIHRGMNAIGPMQSYGPMQSLFVATCIQTSMDVRNKSIYFLNRHYSNKSDIYSFPTKLKASNRLIMYGNIKKRHCGKYKS